MTPYFFHLRDGSDVLLDPEGRLLQGADAIAAAALADARSIIADDARGGVIKLDQHIDVEDASGVIVHELKFTDAVVVLWPKA